MFGFETLSVQRRKGDFSLFSSPLAASSSPTPAFEGPVILRGKCLGFWGAAKGSGVW